MKSVRLILMPDMLTDRHNDPEDLPMKAGCLAFRTEVDVRLYGLFDYGFHNPPPYNIPVVSPKKYTGNVLGAHQDDEGNDLCYVTSEEIQDVLDHLDKHIDTTLSNRNILILLSELPTDIPIVIWWEKIRTG